MRTKRRKGDQFIEFVVSEVFVFMKQTFLFPRLVNCATAGLNEGKKLSGEAPSPGFRSWFLYVLPKISPACQGNLPRPTNDFQCACYSVGCGTQKVNDCEDREFG